MSSKRAKNFAAPSSSALGHKIVFEKRQDLGLVWIDALPIAPQTNVHPVGGQVFEQHTSGSGFMSWELQTSAGKKAGGAGIDYCFGVGHGR